MEAEKVLLTEMATAATRRSVEGRANPADFDPVRLFSMCKIKFQRIRNKDAALSGK